MTSFSTPLFFFIFCFGVFHVQSIEFTNLTFWMTDFAASEPRARTMPFNHWMLPGIHDAGCYYDEAKWRYVYPPTPNSASWDNHKDMTTMVHNPLKPSFPAYPVTLAQTAVTQHLNLRGQLEMGARYFDIRFAQNKQVGKKATVQVDHGPFHFETVPNLMPHFVRYAQALPPQRCEIVWLRVKIESLLDEPLMKDEVLVPFRSLEVHGARGKIHKWWPETDFPDTMTPAQAVTKGTVLPPGLDTLTYDTLCAGANGGRHDGVVYMIILATPKTSIADATGAFLKGMKGRAIIEKNTMLGDAPTRRRITYVLETQKNASVADQVREANNFFQTNGNVVPLPTYRFNHFRRAYMTSTGGQGTTFPAIPVEKAFNLNIFLNSHGIWKFVLPSAINHFKNPAATGYFKIAEGTPVVNHFFHNPTTISDRITAATAGEIQDSEVMNSLVADEFHRWTTKRGYFERSYTHVVMLDFCELSCPTAVYYSTLVMRSRLTPLP